MVAVQEQRREQAREQDGPPPDVGPVARRHVGVVAIDQEGVGMIRPRRLHQPGVGAQAAEVLDELDAAG